MAIDFIVDSDAKAMHVCKQIKEIRDNRDYMVAWYEQKIKEIKEQADFDTLGYENALREYFTSVPHKRTKTQESYSFPGGKLIQKKQDPEFKRDDKTVIEWLKKSGMPQFVKVSETLDWAGLKAETAVFQGAIVDEYGEVIPGIEVTERPDKFVVEVK